MATPLELDNSNIGLTIAIQIADRNIGIAQYRSSPGRKSAMAPETLVFLNATIETDAAVSELKLSFDISTSGLLIAIQVTDGDAA